jgi:DNA-binding MarR family transcriptional regulator
VTCLTTEQPEELLRVSPNEVLQPEWIVLRTIAVAGPQGIHVSALIDQLEQVVSRMTVVKALAKLEQKQMVRAEWIKDATWRRTYFISSRRVEQLVNKGLEPLFESFVKTKGSKD